MAIDESFIRGYNAKNDTGSERALLKMIQLFLLFLVISEGIIDFTRKLDLFIHCL